jgi:hypothetical protein
MKPVLSVIEQKMLNKDSFLNDYLSDHSLIRVEFPELCIYSWNVLNGEDEMALNFTINPLFKQASPSQKKLISKAFIMNNEKRFNGLITKIMNSITQESKPCIIFLQEIGPSILKIIMNHSKLMEYTKIVGEPDVVGFYSKDKTTFNLKNKQEYRVTLIPTSSLLYSIHSFPLKVESKIPQNVNIIAQQGISSEKSFKSQLMIRVQINNKVYHLMNVHANWVTNDVNFVEFFASFANLPNFIAIGDFNRSLEIFKNVWKEVGLKYLVPPKNTFISQMGTGSIKSAKIDQCLYN